MPRLVNAIVDFSASGPRRMLASASGSGEDVCARTGAAKSAVAAKAAAIRGRHMEKIMSLPVLGAAYREGLAVTTAPGVTTPATPAAAAAYVTLLAAVDVRVETRPPVVERTLSAPLVDVIVADATAVPAAAE